MTNQPESSSVVSEMTIPPVVDKIRTVQEWARQEVDSALAVRDRLYSELAELRDAVSAKSRERDRVTVEVDVLQTKTKTKVNEAVVNALKAESETYDARHTDGAYGIYAAVAAPEDIELQERIYADLIRARRILEGASEESPKLIVLEGEVYKRVILSSSVPLINLDPYRNACAVNSIIDIEFENGTVHSFINNTDPTERVPSELKNQDLENIKLLENPEQIEELRLDRIDGLLAKHNFEEVENIFEARRALGLPIDYQITMSAVEFLAQRSRDAEMVVKLAGLNLHLMQDY